MPTGYHINVKLNLDMSDFDAKMAEVHRSTVAARFVAAGFTPDDAITAAAILGMDARPSTGGDGKPDLVDITIALANAGRFQAAAVAQHVAMLAPIPYDPQGQDE